MEKKRDKHKSQIDEEKIKIQSLGKKSEQEQIKQVLESPSKPIFSDIKEEKEEKLQEPPFTLPEPTLSELADKKKQEKEESLLGDDIEIIED